MQSALRPRGCAVARQVGIAFLFARTETEMFHLYVWPYAHSVLFLRGRVSFHKPDGTVKGNAGGPSVLIAYGDEADSRLATCGIPGIYVSLRLTTQAGGRVLFPGRCTRAAKGEPLLAGLKRSDGPSGVAAPGAPGREPGTLPPRGGPGRRG